MPKIEHEGKIVELSYQELHGYTYVSFTLEKLEEFIKTHKENLRGQTCLKNT